MKIFGRHLFELTAGQLITAPTKNWQVQCYQAVCASKSPTFDITSHWIQEQKGNNTFAAFRVCLFLSSFVLSGYYLLTFNIISMRKLSLLFVSTVFMGLMACNSQSSQKNVATADSTQTQAANHSQTATTTEAIALPPVPDGAKVFFKNLKNGQTVTSPFKVEMGVEGMTVAPAGQVKEGTGHHHLLIDAGDSLATGTVVPSDSTHLHFGEGQTETELSLAPGKHTLTLQFADGMHRSYGSKLAATITVNVKK